jgi:thiamine transport system substrate-binding protein
MQKILFFICILVTLTITGTTVSAAAQETITLMTHDSFNVSKKIIGEFEESNQVTVRFLKSGDAGAALIQAILSKDNPMADLFFGVDNTFLSRAIKADIFEPYPSSLLAVIPDQFKLDRQNRLLPVTYGDVCLNIDKKWFKERGLRRQPTCLI